jgi:FkbM family methyltransferase
MKARIVDALLGLYGRVAASGFLDHPLPRRAFEAAYIAYKRLIEAGPVAPLREVVPPGTTVVDAGANIGYFSLRFARWVGEGGRVVAIEPEERNCASLRRRVERAGLAGVVDVVQAAAADRPGELRLAVNPLHPGDHALASEGEPVPAVTFDELTTGDARKVSLLKMDIQGAETMALAGARRVIEEHRPAIFLEIHDEGLRELGSSSEELINTLTGLSYRGHLLTRRGIGPPLDPASLIARTADGYLDALFLPA